MVILGDLQNQEYQFTIPKSWTRLAEKREEEENNAIAKRCAFHKNAVSELYIDIFNTYLNIYSAHLKNMIEMKNLEVDGYLSKQNLFATYIAFP